MDTTQNKTQILIAYVSSVVLLLMVFLSTMVIHDQSIDYGYLIYAFYRILLVSLFAAIVVWQAKTKNNFLSIFLGAFFGFIAAVIYVQISTNI